MRPRIDPAAAWDGFGFVIYYLLSCHIDSGIAADIRIRFFAFKVFMAGVFVTLFPFLFCLHVRIFSV